MNSSNCQWTDSDCSARIKALVAEVGAVACGLAPAGEVSADDKAAYQAWLAASYNAGMAYMVRNMDLRFDPEGLLPGVRTVIAAAFNYRPVQSSPYFADYALGLDYHYVIKERLQKVSEVICREFGGQVRICVDSAPLRERWWAQRAGIAYRGDNGLMIVDGYGSAVFLGFILWTGQAEYDQPSSRECLHCNACRKACPGQAIVAPGVVDARRCLSYLTIEHRGEFPEHMPRMTGIYGCDRCRKSCPLDRGPISDLPEFASDPAIAALTPDQMAVIGSSSFRRIFGKSAVYRLGASGLRRNSSRFSKR